MNYYAKAITILYDSNESTCVRLVSEIARKNPKALCDAADRISPQKPDWRIKAIELIRADRYIEAIKWCRNETGLGLKEAKDQCDILKSSMS